LFIAGSRPEVFNFAIFAALLLLPVQGFFVSTHHHFKLQQTLNFMADF
jgi:hypothetical protein